MFNTYFIVGQKHPGKGKDSKSENLLMIFDLICLPRVIFIQQFVDFNCNMINVQRK